jgi:hypothetical protein
MHSLLTLAMLTIAAPEEPIALLQLSRGQELVYRGHCETTARGPASTSRRQWDISVRIFVLDTADDQAQIAVQTTTREASSADAVATRLMLTDVDYLGRIKLRAESFAIPLDAPAHCNAGAFIELPAKPLLSDTQWEVNDPGRPPLAWSVKGFERIGNGPRCVQLVGEQKTSGFHELGSHREWRRLDHVWLDPRGGMVRKLERIIDLRDPSRREVTSRLVATLELESSLVIPDRLAAERRAEIAMAWSAEQTTIQLTSGQTERRTVEHLSRRLSYHVKQQPVTAYREGLLSAQRRLDDVRSGAAQPLVTAKTNSAKIATGEPAPEFIANEVATGAPVRLGGPSDRPMVLIFFKQESVLTDVALAAAAKVMPAAVVAGMNISDYQTAAIGRRNGLFVPTYDGRDAAKRYAVTATPRFVVIDEAGVIRQLIDGYGSEVDTILANTVESAGSTR